MIRLDLISAVALCACVSIATGAGRPVKVQPNLIIIMADDLGYSDLGCYGGELNTPALDRMATEGIRLTHCYNGGMCVVSRASLMTGQWWPRALPTFTQSKLLPEHLKEAGYRTALIGKWHEEGHPMDQGFDRFFGFLNGFCDHFIGDEILGAKFYQDDREVFSNFGPDFYSTEAFTDRAIDFVGQKKGEPFFLYLAYQAPHNPLQAPKEDIMKQRGNYSQGWKAVREARFERQKKLGIVAADATLQAYPENLPEWASLSDEQRDLEDLRMSVYAAMVEGIDQGVGRLVEALKKNGQADNTLIVFLSDNGTDSFSVVDKGLLEEGKLPGDPESNYQPGTGWAYATVTPWRMYKISQHNGGVASGAIAWWADAPKKGFIEHSPVHVVDFLPTFAELAGVEPDVDGLAGESFASLLKGKSWARKGPMFFQYMDNRAIRSGEWTLAEVDSAGWELFNRKTDPMEDKDLSALHPERVAEMAAQWESWWTTEGDQSEYVPTSTDDSPHYKAQGDRGSGELYVPSAMPAHLKNRYPAE